MDKLINLKESEMINFGWFRDTIIAFLNDPECDGYAVLGGDVLRFNITNNKYEYTYDSWYVPKRLLSESFENYCRRSQSVAKEYIESYPSTKDVIFSPVISTEVTAGL